MGYKLRVYYLTKMFIAAALFMMAMIDDTLYLRGILKHVKLTRMLWRLCMSYITSLLYNLHKPLNELKYIYKTTFEVFILCYTLLEVFYI